MSWYRTGTIALTNGSDNVTGTGTDFLTGAATGEAIVAPDNRMYEILSIQSATSLKIGAPYLGATASGQPYAIAPTQSYIRDLAAQVAALVNGYASTKDNALLLTNSAKTTPVDADSVSIRDSVTALGRLVTWANIKAALKTYFDSVATTLSNKTLANPAFSGTTANLGTVTTMDLNGGTIDGTAIGGVTPAAGAFTTLSSSGNAALGDANTDTLNVGNSDLLKTTDGYLRLARAGIQFNGDTAAANALDDYEEGAFTPTIVGTSTAGVGTYSAQVGRYTKIGNRVYFSAAIVWSAHTGIGNMRISALPFTAANIANGYGFLAVGANALTYSGQLTAYVEVNTSQCSFATFSTGGALSLLAIDTAASVYVSGHYEV